jgi:membrane-anchored glycerophosphoryl diester phosphodiesterase (GDPDase)
MKKRIFLLLFVIQIGMVLPVAAQMLEYQADQSNAQLEVLETKFNRMEQRVLILTGLLAVSFIANAGLMLYIIRMVKDGKNR